MNPSDPIAAGYGPVTVLSTLAWGLGYFGMPHILLRFMAIEDEKKLVLSRRIASVWVVISMTVAVCIGMIGYSANAEIELSRAKNVLSVPESAIEFDGDKTYVYVKTNNGKKAVYERRAVKTGLSDGVDIEIKSGLTRKDVVRGPEKVTDTE